MYVKSIEIKNFRCFEQATMEFQYPGRRHGNKKAPRLPNVNLILGDNGSGKSAILKAIALTLLTPIQHNSGYVPYLLVRRSKNRQPGEPLSDDGATLMYEMLVSLEDTLLSEDAWQANIPLDSPREFIGTTEILRRKTNEELKGNGVLYQSQFNDTFADDYSPAFFIAGYGATRRVEDTGNFDRGARERTRRPRYQRVTTLFEDYYSLVPINVCLDNFRAEGRLDIFTELLNKVLPSEVRIDDDVFLDYSFSLSHKETYSPVFAWDNSIFNVNGVMLPFTGLSDGYRSFIGWLCDLLYHMNRVTQRFEELTDLSGIVMVDEIDLLLHPEWQRTVIESLAKTFENLQFFFTTHSPIVAGTVEAANILIAERDPETGSAIVTPGAEKIYALSADQILTSSYFGLSTPRATGAVDEMKELAHRAWEGDKGASLTFLTRLAQGFEKENSNGEG